MIFGNSVAPDILSMSRIPNIDRACERCNDSSLATSSNAPLQYYSHGRTRRSGKYALDHMKGETIDTDTFYAEKRVAFDYLAAVGSRS